MVAWVLARIWRSCWFKVGVHTGRISTESSGRYVRVVRRGASMRLRVFLILLLAAALSLSSCSWFGSTGKTSWRGAVGQGEVRAEVGEATVVFPDGVAPAGTKATVELRPREDWSP